MSVPVNYRIVNKQEGKTKHEYFLEMLQSKSLGPQAKTATGDSWYASKNNLNTIKDKGFQGLFALEANRLVSVELETKYVQIQTLDIPQDGLIV